MRHDERKLAILTSGFLVATAAGVGLFGPAQAAGLPDNRAPRLSVAPVAEGSNLRLGFAALSDRAQAPRLASPMATVPHPEPAAFTAPPPANGIRPAPSLAEVPLPQPPATALMVHRLAEPGAALPTRLAALEKGFHAPASDAELGLSPFGTACGVTLGARVQPAAMVVLVLDAPCQPRQRVELRHEGLIFAAMTDGMGQLSVQVPALATEARFEATLSSGAVVRAEASVPDAAALDRVIVQWAGPVALNLHALEFGAAEGSAGHVWQGASQSAAHALRSGGGFLTALGDPGLDPPLLAEVYSLPLTPETQQGVVRLILEADAEVAGCDQQVAATTWRIGPQMPGAALDIDFKMPPCGEDGQILLLKNAVQDLKIARN